MITHAAVASNVTRAVYFPGGGIQIENVFSPERQNDTCCSSDELPAPSITGAMRRDLSQIPIKTSFQRIVLDSENDEKQTMSKDEINELRKSVIQSNRPLNPWYENKCGSQTATPRNIQVKVPVEKRKQETSAQPIQVVKTTADPRSGKEVMEALKRYNNYYAGSSLKNQLLQQQQREKKPKEQNLDYDLSNVVASDIKMLEQLEIDHLKRANNLATTSIENTKAATKCGESFASFTSTMKLITNNRSNESKHSSADENFQFDPVKCQSNRNDIYDNCKLRDHIEEERYNNMRDTIEPLPNTPSQLQENIGLLDCHKQKQQHSVPHLLNKRALGTMSQVCYICNKAINDVILQALGNSYHIECFRCTKCNRCLNGIPFAVDTVGKVFCMDDYEEMFIPACIACHKPIHAINEYRQVVRIAFQSREYHVDCFKCEGCGLQLSNEQANRCYPLSSHLLCRHCHFQWKRLGGTDPPITDL